jgi:uncharacterized repeat protein (TIGR01451 family)
MKKRIRMLLPILVILAMLVSMFGVATPVMASMILVTKDVTDPFVVNIYYVGDTIYYHMTVENPGNNTQTNTLTRIWDTMPNGTVIEFLNTTAHETLVQAPGDVKDCFTTYVVNASDIQWIVPTDPNVASYWGVKNRFEAEGYDSAHDDVYGRVNKNSQVIRPKLSIEKTVDFNGDGVYSDLETNLAESTASWNVTVCNSGYDPVYDITVTDTNGYDFGAAFNLSVGECKTFTYDKVMNVSAVNNATAEGFDVLGNPVGPVSDDAQVVVVDARITISPSATNKVGDSHNFTVFVEKNDGTGWVAASGVSVTGNISGVGSITSTNPANTDGSGHMTITITSSDPGTSTVQASATVNVGGINIDVATNGYGAHDIANVKAWVDARISIGESGTNPINTAHNFTVTVEKNDGSGWVAASGVSVTGSISGVGSITSTNPANTDVNGHMTITITSAVAGISTVQASGTVNVGGIDIAVATNGYGAYITQNVKEWTSVGSATRTWGFWKTHLSLVQWMYG